MILTCTVCDNGINSAGNPCLVCGGDGEFTLVDSGFVNTQGQWPITGMVWDAMLTKLEDVESLADDLIDQNVDILEKLAEIKEVVDAL